MGLVSARSGWRLLAFSLGGLMGLPIFSIAILALQADGDIWRHLSQTVLPGYIGRTLQLGFGVGILSLVFGTLSAWLVTHCEFPLRRIFAWALVLPLAMPSYIIAYTYVHSFEYAGPVQTYLRGLFNFTRPQDYWFPEIRSMSGAVFVMSLVLYPYVYLAARAAFLRLSPHQLEAARMLGRNAYGAFYHVALPLARPALVAGAALAIMEAVNDIGAANFFGVRTLTLGIYTTWLRQGSLGGAAQIALMMLIIIIGLIGLERKARQAQNLTGHAKHDGPIRRIKLRGQPKFWAMVLLCSLIGLGFILPASVLGYFAVSRLDMFSNEQFHRALGNSLLMALLASGFTAIIGLAIAYAKRNRQDPIIRGFLSFAGLGYALPGTILGIGLLVPLAQFDNWLDGWMRLQFGISTGLILSGSLVALWLGYSIRFLAIATGNFETGLQRITPSLAHAARILGRGPLASFWHVHLPLLRPAIGAALLLVFVDCMKELPATLILRPFDFDTLATLVYQLASLDQLEESALPALAIVVAGLLPVVLLSRSMAKMAEGPSRLPEA